MCEGRGEFDLNLRYYPWNSLLSLKRCFNCFQLYIDGDILVSNSRYLTNLTFKSKRRYVRLRRFRRLRERLRRKNFMNNLFLSLLPLKFDISNSFQIIEVSCGSFSRVGST